MANERLRSAIYSAGMTLDQLSERVEVDPKTIERWISKDRVPHRANRQRVALALSLDEVAIWPDVATNGAVSGGPSSEIVRVYPSRGAIPTETWVDLIDGTEERMDILGFAGSFLHDALPSFVERLKDRASAGVEVRLLFGDPDSQAVAIRGEEEGIGESLRERCRLTWKYLRPLVGVDGIEMRQHGCTLYQSLFRFDHTTLVNQHTYGSAASQSPVLQLQAEGEAPLASTFRRAFETVWSQSRAR